MNHLTIILDDSFLSEMDLMKEQLNSSFANFTAPTEFSFNNWKETEKGHPLSCIFCSENMLPDVIEKAIIRYELLSLTHINESYDDIKNLIRLKSSHKLPSSLLDFFSLGIQRHLITEKDSSEFYRRYFETYNVGMIKDHIKVVEPCFRDSNIVIINLNSMKKSEFSSKTGYNPSGFTSEEFVQLCRYAGISLNIDQIIFVGIDENEIGNNKSDQIFLSQCLWYFMEGLNSRHDSKHDDPKNKIYVFEIEELNDQFNFIQHHKTKRWWISWNENQHKTVISANESDFHQIKSGNIPDRLLSAYYRYQ